MLLIISKTLRRKSFQCLTTVWTQTKTTHKRSKECLSVSIQTLLCCTAPSTPSKKQSLRKSTLSSVLVCRGLTRKRKFSFTRCSIRQTSVGGKHFFSLILSLFRESKILSLNCQRVGTKKGERLVRVSVVNFYGNIVLDTLIKPWSAVTDFRQEITGISKVDLRHAPSFPKVLPIVSLL